MQMIMAVNSVLLVAFVLSFGLGILVFARAFVMDWRSDLQTFGEMARSKKLKANALEQLNEFIRSHSNVKR